MLRNLLFAAASAVILAACSSTPETTTTSTSNKTTSQTEVSPFNLAFKTADELVAAGNTPTAIQRLMQLAGDTTLTPNEKAATLYRLGDLSISPTGYDAVGAEEYFTEVLYDYPASPSSPEASKRLPEATALVAALQEIVNDVSATKSEKFNALMLLGEHQDAIDIMVANDLTPGNEELLAMYQIGYLCEDSNLTGRAYPITDRDGSERSVRFCDFGK